MSYKSHDHRLFYPKTGNIIFQRIWFFYLQCGAPKSHRSFRSKNMNKHFQNTFRHFRFIL